MTAGRAGCPGSKSEDELEELDFEAEIDDFGGKIGEISWMEGGEARSTSHTQTSRIKTNKISTHEQITKKKLGLFLVGISEIRTKLSKKG